MKLRKVLLACVLAIFSLATVWGCADQKGNAPKDKAQKRAPAPPHTTTAK